MYIKDLEIISPQDTLSGHFNMSNVLEHEGLKFFAFEPDYMEIIPPALLRRMGRVVKLGIGTGLKLVQKHTNLDGIILGTANGGLDDCFKFLYQIVDYEEGTLTPTNFVQSTPGAIAGNLALMSKNNGYNNTHVNGALSFEAAMLDAMLLLDESPEQRFLLGCADEISDNNFNINRKLGLYKSSFSKGDDLLRSGTKGTVYGEGAFMYVVDTSPEDALANIRDVDQITNPTPTELDQKLNVFLEKNGLSVVDIDGVVLGRNGNITRDQWYAQLEEKFPAATHVVYKHLSGEFQTVAGFALWLAIQLLNEYPIPDSCFWKKEDKRMNRILLYNHYRGEQHSFILLER